MVGGGERGRAFPDWGEESKSRSGDLRGETMGFGIHRGTAPTKKEGNGGRPVGGGTAITSTHVKYSTGEIYNDGGEKLRGEKHHTRNEKGEGSTAAYLPIYNLGDRQPSMVITTMRGGRAGSRGRMNYQKGKFLIWGEKGQQRRLNTIAMAPGHITASIGTRNGEWREKREELIAAC